MPERHYRGSLVAVLDQSGVITTTNTTSVLLAVTLLLCSSVSGQTWVASDSESSSSSSSSSSHSSIVSYYYFSSSSSPSSSSFSTSSDTSPHRETPSSFSSSSGDGSNSSSGGDRGAGREHSSSSITRSSNHHSQSSYNVVGEPSTDSPPVTRPTSMGEGSSSPSSSTEEQITTTTAVPVTSSPPTPIPVDFGSSHSQVGTDITVFTVTPVGGSIINVTLLLSTISTKLGLSLSDLVVYTNRNASELSFRVVGDTFLTAEATLAYYSSLPAEMAAMGLATMTYGDPPLGPADANADDGLNSGRGEKLGILLSCIGFLLLVGVAMGAVLFKRRIEPPQEKVDDGFRVEACDGATSVINMGSVASVREGDASAAVSRGNATTSNNSFETLAHPLLPTVSPPPCPPSSFGQNPLLTSPSSTAVGAVGEDPKRSATQEVGRVSASGGSSNPGGPINDSGEEEEEEHIIPLPSPPPDEDDDDGDPSIQQATGEEEFDYGNAVGLL